MVYDDDDYNAVASAEAQIRVHNCDFQRFGDVSTEQKSSLFLQCAHTQRLNVISSSVSWNPDV